MNWLEIELDDLTIEVDADFLTSSWTCIWDRGCAGIGEVADPDAQLGCCSVGAEMLDEQEAMTISALAASIDPSRAQFADDIADGGALRQVDSGRAEWATRVVDGACIFLNRPGFSGGSGCALHLEAVAVGEPAVDWKPSICWQLPIKLETVEPAAGQQGQQEQGQRLRLRRWLRTDWGPEGEQMAYCCTEPASTPADAFVGSTSVVDSLANELVALLGTEAYGQLAERLKS